jgi:alpha-L-fucosidase 2
MLLQSHADEVELLPALPSAWSKGNVKGLVARGGFEVDINWENGSLRQARILSGLGAPLRLSYNGKVSELKSTEKGKTYLIRETDSGLTIE